MTDINESLATLAADAEGKRARVEIENEMLRKELNLTTEERDSLIFELEREKKAHELHHGGPA